MAEKKFLWGAATASFQIEGGVNEGGRGPCIWDAFCRTPGRVVNMENGDIACDSYHRYMEDVKLLKELGVDSYRFSIAWPRIQPNGVGEANPEGIAYYNKLIDALIENGITPFVTLYHWDLPLDLQICHDGWLNRSIVDKFVEYAKICFDNFGDRVKHWITFNEPWCVSLLGYGTGSHAPGRKSDIEAYQAAHNLLLSHAYTVKLFRENKYDGIIGITNNTEWKEPMTDSADDIEAADRAVTFDFGWFTDPVVFGDYPQVMKERVGHKMPKFTEEEKALLKNSVDFIGLNHYSTKYVSNTPVEGCLEKSGNIYDDPDVYNWIDPEWEKTQMGWSFVPWGLNKLLKWIGKRYNNIPIYITENGCATEGIDDDFRCRFLTQYIDATLEARDKDNVNVAGYFCWSLLDNFEWAYGYAKTFGIIACSPQNTDRVPKKSYYTYRDIISRNR
ncbi:MAG: beta-glucosidase [Lentisphaeria bacterium]|nr:beta-glucosidase [Lentisphaeria bacterium]MBO5765081.1 beta-glucosidase [Lentisphaeria bacterium]MBO7153568.1 beta-glucosidase [Lentisphaeria bacterium]